MSFYFNTDKKSISSQNGLYCGLTDENQIISKILDKDQKFNYDFIFYNIFLDNPKINKYIDIHKLHKIKYNHNLEPIQILVRILSHKRVRKFLLNDFKLLSSLDRSINEFKKAFTKVTDVLYITEKKDYPHFLKNSNQQIFKITYDNGDIFYFKNLQSKLKHDDLRLKNVTTLKNSQLRPSSLDLKDKYSKKQLIRLLKLKLKKITSNDNIRLILSLILNSLKKQSDSLKIEGLKALLKNVSSEDERSIFRDFGEIISAIHLCNDNQKIYFSKQNEELIDFVIEDENQKKFYSCKFSSSNKKGKGGSRSSLLIIKNYMSIFENELNEDEKELYKILRIITDTKGSFNSYKNLADYLNISKDCEKEFNSLKEKDKFIGRKIYLYAKNCKNFLNNSIYKKTLNSVLNKIDIEQIYLIYDDKDTIFFDIKNFNQLEFVFDSAVSVNKYNFKLSFRMK